MPKKLPIRRVKAAVFDGHRFKIQWHLPRVSKKEARKHKGEVLYGKAHLAPPRRLNICMNPILHPTPTDLFATLLHESSHASFPQLDEESILAHEHDFMAFIKRVGFKISL
jgi:hypothetical protein